MYFSAFQRAQDFFRDVLAGLAGLYEDNLFLSDFKKFVEILDGEGGFLWCHWCGSGDCEERIKDDTKATIRCIPLRDEPEEGKCIRCGERSERRVIFARAY